MQQQPDMPRAHFLAGKIALEHNDFDQAVNAFEATVRLNENYSAAWLHLARIFAMTGKFVKAEGCLNNAIATEKGNPVTYDLIGTVYRFLGQLENSREWHEKAVRRDPQNVDFLVNLANNRLYFGALDEARVLLTQALGVEPHNAQLHWLVSRTGPAQTENHVKEMNTQLERSRDDRERAWLNYACGKELEDLEQWEAAFAAYERGAVARRSTVEYNEEANSEMFEILASQFTRDWLESRTEGVADAAPIFIVGQPRTGSTLLDRMLGAHPEVTSAGELRHLGIAVRRATGLDEPIQFTPELMRAAVDADIELLGEAYRTSTDSLSGEGAHFIDKLPSNYLFMPLILAALPTARIIHIRRDPMDSCFAMYKQLFADAYLYSYDQHELARHYVRYAALMDTWRSEFEDRFFEVDYEPLVTNPEESVRGVLEYIGLSWNPACLDFVDSGSAVTTASAAQVREAPHTRSVGRWKNFASNLDPMREILVEAGLVAS